MIQSILSNQVVAVIVVLAILIFIHELGHFAVAKYSGVGVEVFSLGFGPRILGYKYGETDYRISLVPFGGYVKMVGESPDAEVDEDQKQKSFTFKRVSVRAAIVFAGPIMNLVFAAFLMPLIFIIGVPVPKYLDRAAIVGFVDPDYAPYKAGVIEGDVIKAVDGTRIDKWFDLDRFPELIPGKTYELDVDRGGDLKKIKVLMDESSGKANGFAGILPAVKPVIGDVSSKSPAQEAGLKPDDEIVSINGKKVTHFAQIGGILQLLGEKESAIFAVMRKGAQKTITVTPKFNEELKKKIVGISQKPDTETKSYGVIESIEKGAYSAYAMTVKLFVVIKGLIVGKYSLKTLGGPIQIAQEAGKAAQAGSASFITLLAFISLQLGIINLFPIPVLDGGLLFFFAIEAVKGSPLSEKFMSISQQVGMALLLLLMLLVTYNDIARIIRG